jgi:hypothetical protein
MLTIEDIKNHVRQILDDAGGDRFSDALLESSIRQALAHVDEKLPLIRTLDQQITSAGRDQALTGLVHPLYLIQISWAPSSVGGSEREINTGYSYTLQGNTGMLSFNDHCFPCAGETLQVTYAAQNTLAGLDGATETTITDAAIPALDCGAASFACLLRAASLAETYGARTGESARLVEQSKLWKELSEEALNKIKTLQPFDFPSGFALDQWDR